MQITNAKWGWRYLAVGVIACLVLSAVAGANGQNPALAALLACVALAVYIALFELHAIMTAASSKMSVVAIAGVAAIACIVVLMTATEALISGNFDLRLRRPVDFAFPGAMALVVIGMLWRRRKRPTNEQ